jgi:hypothetical protein
MPSKPAGKKSRHFLEVEAAKERFRQESSETLLKRKARGYLTKVGSIAIREVLAERQRTEN